MEAGGRQAAGVRAGHGVIRAIMLEDSLHCGHMCGGGRARAVPCAGRCEVVVGLQRGRAVRGVAAQHRRPTGLMCPPRTPNSQVMHQLMQQTNNCV